MALVGPCIRIKPSSLTMRRMSNCNVTRFRGIHHRTSVPLYTRRRWRNGCQRTLSTKCLLKDIATPFDAPQRSDEWFALRKDKLTTSTFSTALGFWKGKRRAELWHEKVFASETQASESSQTLAMEWGVLNERAAIERYRNITGREVSSLGFAIHPKKQFDWLGASPDGILGCFPGGGILEVKCPYNKGKPETAVPWKTVPFYYMPQVQGQMEIMDREWVDLYCWMPNRSTIFRVHRDRSYWSLIHGILREFWTGNVLPAREAMLAGKEDEVKTYEPASIHKHTGFAIFKSIKLASEAKILCRESAGHVEFIDNATAPLTNNLLINEPMVPPFTYGSTEPTKKKIVRKLVPKSSSKKQVGAATSGSTKRGKTANTKADSEAKILCRESAGHVEFIDNATAPLTNNLLINEPTVSPFTDGSIEPTKKKIVQKVIPKSSLKKQEGAGPREERQLTPKLIVSRTVMSRRPPSR